MRKRTDRILFEGAGHLFTEMGKKKVQVHVEKTEWIMRVEKTRKWHKYYTHLFHKIY